MKNIGGIKNCFGCGVCALACGKHLISLCLNEDGFYQPFIQDTEKCINCGLCLDVCSFNNSDLAATSKVVKAYAGWSGDKEIRRKCSSGGVGYEIGRSLIEKGYKVCGVRYNVQDERAEHFIASTKEQLLQSIGSKYLQSYSLSGFQDIVVKDKYLVIGAPCQIDSFRRFIKRFKCEDNFILVDFFCHGVPSYLLWKKYLEENKRKVGTIVSASWRNKSRQSGCEDVNWHDSWDIHILGEKGCSQSKLSEGDLFYRFFIGNYCLNQCCYDKCRFKGVSSSADIRLGDCWGRKYSNDKEGVSSVIVFTDKGVNVLNKMELCIFLEEDLSCVTEGQYKTTVSKPFVRDGVLKMLKGNKSLQTIHKLKCKPYLLLNIPKRVVKKLFRK